MVVTEEIMLYHVHVIHLKCDISSVTDKIMQIIQRNCTVCNIFSSIFILHKHVSFMFASSFMHLFNDSIHIKIGS